MIIMGIINKCSGFVCGIMRDVDIDEYVGRFDFVEFVYNIFKEDFGCFVVAFVKIGLKTFNVDGKLQ